MNCKTKQMLRSLEFSPEIKSYATAQGEFREPLNNPNAKSAGGANRATVLRKRRKISNRKAEERNRPDERNRVYRRLEGSI